MKLAILGTVGVPARYGGFETLAENLVQNAETQAENGNTLTVYCSARAYPERPKQFLGARLRYSRLNPNGPQSVAYDALTALDAVFRGHDTLLFLGVSGAMAIPLLRLVTRCRIVTNVDGIEWRRDKWHGVARRFLRWSEALAVRFSHDVIADNQGIADHLQETYGVKAEVIAYGGDHALDAENEQPIPAPNLPQDYALALCRIEPENNVEMILEACDGATRSLVFVGNWANSDYGRALRARFGDRPGLHLLDPIYAPRPLYQLRQNASVYVHGHSAGGTNPSLVEMMHFDVPVLAYDCTFNRHTTEGRAAYFSTADQLSALVNDQRPTDNGEAMREIAQRLYRWDEISERYFALMRSRDHSHGKGTQCISKKPR